MTQQHNKSKMTRVRNAGQGSPHLIGGKPRLLDLINTHHVSTIHLAHAARLRVSTVRAMALQEKPVQPVIAMQVLHGLWELTGRQHMLTDIDMPGLPYNETAV